MDAPAAAAAVEAVLQLRTVRDPAARAQFLAAIRGLGREDADFTVERLDALMRVEEHFQALLLYDQVDFLRQPAAISEADRDFALNVQRACLESANGFQRFLRNRSAWATTAAARQMVPRLTGLALNAIHCFVKWSCFLNEPGKATPWKQIHALYLLAESEGYSKAAFVLHGAQPAFRPSVQSLYLRTLLLDLLNSGNLSRLQVEIADGWFSAWCAAYSLDAGHSPRHHVFVVDLASDSGMQLVGRGGRGASPRYVRIDGLQAQIEEVRTGLRHGRLFAGHGAGALFPVEAHVALLSVTEKLCQSILAGDQGRIEERTPFEDREVEVSLGFDRLVRRMTPHAGGGNDAPVPAAAHDPQTERWRVHDLSSNGFGLIVDRGAADEVVLNGLVGLRNHETGGWMVACVVRKLPHRVRGEMLVGVEVLCFRPVLVDLHNVKAREDVAALYLPGRDANGKLDSLLLRASDFGSGSLYDLALGETAYRVQLNRILRKGADWIRARFEIKGKV
ncbi:MAG TPA: hypothetical protein VFK48_15390 [Usitatibacter sp.]|nr:hypothetical protein [Usitatibacter sp.]